MPDQPPPDPAWRISPGLTGYPDALAAMETRAAAVRDGTAPELAWLVEHPPLLTAGTSARADDLIDARRFPIHAAGRGGRYTYHGPGQRVGYLMLDLGRRGRDVRRFVHGVEGWLVAALADLGVAAWTDPARVGIWVAGPDGRAAKVGAIGVRVRRWVTLHGFALNVAPDLSHFAAIVPCGLPDPVTSLAELGVDADVARVDSALRARFPAFLAALSRRADSS